MPGVPLLCAVCVFVLTQRAPGQLAPVRASYDAIPGRPLIISVRPEKNRHPKPRVTLRFPDGREIAGEVAAVRLVPPQERTGGWLADAPTWRVLAPGEVRSGEGLAWFVLADLPEDVIGQEVWLAGRPISLRWLPRPRLLASRLGFDADHPDRSPLADPWVGPLPDDWRGRPDLLDALGPAFRDPLRRWRAELATRGLHPSADRGVGPITPELLGTGLVEATAKVAPLADRLLDAIASQNEARWRIALARLWAAAPGLSLRVRQALAGAGRFPIGGHPGEAAVVPVWTADGRDASGLLSMLLEGNAGTRGENARRWLAEAPKLSMWIIDDGAAGGSARIGAMYLDAGDTTAIPLTGRDVRPVLLTTRLASMFRPNISETNHARGMLFEARIAGHIERVTLEPGPAPLAPPGETIGPVWADYSMSAWLAADPADRAARLGSTRISGRVTRSGTSKAWSVFLRSDAPGTVRLWIGPAKRTAGVLTVGLRGGVDLQRFDRVGERLGEPGVVRGTDESGATQIEITLPAGSVEPDGTLHLGLEFVDEQGRRVAWPRPMLPWQIEPARRVLDTRAWMGGLGTDD